MKWPVAVAGSLLVAGGLAAYTLATRRDGPVIIVTKDDIRFDDPVKFDDPSLPPSTRVQILRDAAEHGSPRSIGFLEKVANSDDKLAAQAASALGSVTNPAAAPALATIALDRRASVLARSGALRGLAKTGVRDHAADLANLTADRGAPPRVREEAALALMKLGSPADVPALARALSDDDEQIRISAEQALGAIGGADAKAALAARRAQSPTQAEQVFLDRALAAH